MLKTHLGKIFPQISGLMHLDNGGQKLVMTGSHPEHGDLKLTSKVDDRTRRETDIVTTRKFPGVPVLYEWGTVSFGNGMSGISLRNAERTYSKVSSPAGRATQFSTGNTADGVSAPICHKVRG